MNSRSGKSGSGRSYRVGIARSGFALLAAVMTLTACDSAVGIPGDEPAEMTLGPAPTTTTPTTTSITTQAPLPPPPLPVGPPVGEVPGNVDAAAALRPFVADLTTGGIGVVTARCWTVPPTKIPAMYFDSDAILAAVANPGVDGQFAVTWTGPTATVSVKRSEIASGYSCPMIYPTGTPPIFDAVDAVYVVERYLSRATQRPVNRDDLESAYPLVCEGSRTWDPAGTGSLIAPPLVDNPDNLDGITAFNPDTVFVTAQNGLYTDVNADVTDSSGAAVNRTFILAIGGEGYCIGDIA